MEERKLLGEIFEKFVEGKIPKTPEDNQAINTCKTKILSHSLSCCGLGGFLGYLVEKRFTGGKRGLLGLASGMAFGLTLGGRTVPVSSCCKRALVLPTQFGEEARRLAADILPANHPLLSIQPEFAQGSNSNNYGVPHSNQPAEMNIEQNNNNFMRKEPSGSSYDSFNGNRGEYQQYTGMETKEYNNSSSGSQELDFFGKPKSPVNNTQSNNASSSLNPVDPYGPPEPSYTKDYDELDYQDPQYLHSSRNSFYDSPMENRHNEPNYEQNTKVPGNDDFVVDRLSIAEQNRRARLARNREQIHRVPADERFVN